MTTSLMLAQMHGTHSSVMQSELLPCAEETGLKWEKFKMEWYYIITYEINYLDNLTLLILQ